MNIPKLLDWRKLLIYFASLAGHRHAQAHRKPRQGAVFDILSLYPSSSQCPIPNHPFSLTL
jgi:hypothetical protein